MNDEIFVNNSYFPEETAALHLAIQDGIDEADRRPTSALIKGILNHINVKQHFSTQNGIYQNGHLIIDHVPSQHSIPRDQGTKSRDRTKCL